MTKKEMFAHIAEINASETEIVEFCNHEIELLSKRSPSSGKPTKTQIENLAYKEAMLETMTELNEPVTISELQEKCPAISMLKNQRISAMMTQLKNENKVVRTVDHKKAYFAVASVENE